MTIIDKIKTSVEGATGLPFLYHAAGEINELVSRANSLPISFAFLLDSGTIEDVNGRYHERVTLAVMFTDKTEFDFNALENEEIIDRMKVKAYKWLDSLRNSNDLQIVSVNSTQRLYDTTTDILTGYAVNITLQDMQGVGECELPEVVIPITENGIYNVVGVDKVDVKLFVTLKDLYVTRNGVYNPQDFGAYGFGSVNVNVHGEEDLVPAYDWLKNRVKGSEDGTIPAILLKEPFDAINLVENLSVLDNRRITSGEDIPYGVSLARILCDSSIQISSIIDNNIKWNCDKLLKVLYSAFPTKKVVLNCKTLTFDNDKGWTDSCTNIEELEMPELETIYFTGFLGYEQSVFSGMSIERLYFPKLKSYTSGGYGVVVSNSPVKYIDLPQFTTLQCVYANRVVINCAELLELNIPNYAGPSNSWGYRTIDNCPKIRKVVIGECYLGLVISGEHPDLIEVQIAENYNIDLPMETWNPTNALADNLSTFLSNFQTYIADRVADRVGQSALSLTLSADVYAALESQEGQTILATLTNKNWTVVQY